MVSLAIIALSGDGRIALCGLQRPCRCEISNRFSDSRTDRRAHFVAPFSRPKGQVPLLLNSLHEVPVIFIVAVAEGKVAPGSLTAA